jgi:hypothetical protein
VTTDNQETQDQVSPDAAAAAAAAADLAKGKQPEPDARAWVPEKLKGHKSLEKFKTSEDALNGYLNLESAYGKKFEENLKADAPPEVRARVKAALGIPDSPDAYEFAESPKGEDGKPQLVLDETIAKSFKAVAHEAGLSKAQVKKLSEWQVNLELGRSTVQSQERKQAETQGMEKLNADWGAAAPRNIALVQQLVREVAGAEVAAYLNESGMTNDPRMVRFLHAAAVKFQEDNLMTPNPVGLSTDDAAKELAVIRKDARTNGYLDRDHPDHKRIVARVHELTQLTSPDA